MGWRWWCVRCGSAEDVDGSPVRTDKNNAMEQDRDTSTMFVQVDDDPEANDKDNNDITVFLQASSDQDSDEEPSCRSNQDETQQDGALPRESIDIAAALDQLQAFRLDETKLALIRKLTSAASSKVWLGFYAKKQVAVKKKTLKDQQMLRLFVAEITTLAQLNHPNILKLVGCSWTSAGELVEVTEFLEGGDLRSVLNSQTRLTWKRTKVSIALEIAQALVYLHALEPRLQFMGQLIASKVLLNNRFEAKLSKVGLRRDYNFEESWKMSYEAVRWTAPEVLLGEESSEASDLYSFGVLMSELDTRQIPCVEGFSVIRCSNHQEAFMEQVTEGLLRPKFSWDCPPCIHSIAQLCLQLDPAFRPSAQQLVALLMEARAQLCH